SIAGGGVGSAGVDLAPTEMHAVTVVGHAPTGAGTGMLTITTDLTTGGSKDIGLSILGVKDGVAANPTALEFASQPAAVASAPRPVSIVNCSTSPLVITGVAIGGTDAAAFAEQGPATMTLAVGADQAWSVTFTAKHAGNHGASLDFTTDHGPISVQLTGAGA